MKKIFAISIIGVSLLLLLVLINRNLIKKEEYLPVENVEKEVITSIEKGKEYEKETHSWAIKQAGKYADHLEINYIYSQNDNVSKKNSKKEPIKFLIAGAISGDINIFLSSFHTETIIQDLTDVRLDERIQTIKDIMNKISRNGTLKGVYLENKMGIFNSPSNEMKITFAYRDNVKATVEIELVPIEESHGTHTQHYVIITSLWDIVKSIETALN